MRIGTITVAALLLAGAHTPLDAHHSPARFDLNRVVELEGTVSRFDFSNPHAYIYLDVADDTGTTTWELEASSTPNLVRRGWGPDSVEVGDRIRVTVNPPRLGGLTARAQTLHWRDGRTLAVRGGGSVVPPGDPDVRASTLAGIWLGRYGLAQVGTGLADWPLTDKGRIAQAAYDGSQNPHVDCIPVAAPSLMLYSNVYTVGVQAERITIDVEWMNTRRVVHLDAALAPGARSNQGFSTGYWDGDALIVETQAFADNGAGNAFEIPSGAQKRLTERFELAAGGAELHYEFELVDPEYLSETITGSGIWDYRPDLSPLPNQCDLEVARRFLQETAR